MTQSGARRRVPLALFSLLALQANGASAADAPAEDPSLLDATAPPKDADDQSLAEKVLDVRGLSELSLERLLDLPVVTASGKAEERSLAAANVFTITSEEIRKRGFHSLAEILRQVPGLYLSYDYVNHSVGVREVTGGYLGGTRIVKIMIDGFPIGFRPNLEAFLGPEFIPVEAIERVEVAKGPLSALYGANAFLATVNVITREPEKTEVEVAQRYWVVNGNPGAGTSAIASYSGLDRSLLIAASIDRIDRSGAQATPTYPFQNLQSPALLEASGNDLSRPTSVFGRFDYHHDQLGDFRLELGRQGLDAKTEWGLNSLVTHRSRVSLVNQFATLSWQKRSGDLDLRAYVGASRGYPTEEYQLFLTGNFNESYRPRSEYRALNSLAELSYDFAHWLQADLGADVELAREQVPFYTQTSYRERPFEKTDLLTDSAERSQNYRQVGTYLQLRSAPLAGLPDLRLTGAARTDWIRFGSLDYPVQTSFRGALAYRFTPRFAARLIGGRAFQTPSGTLLFSHGGFGNSQNVIGTERLEKGSLKPQVVTSLELVATGQIGEALSIEASIYYQALTDAIRFTRASNIFIAKNSGNVSTAGGELILNAHLGRFRPYAAASTSTQIEASLTRDLLGLTSFSGSPSMYPRFFGYLGVDAELIRTALSLNVQLWWASKRGASQANFYQNHSLVYSLPSYRLLDLTLSAGPLPVLDPELGTSLSLAVRNALDQQQSEPGFAGVDIPQPGTSLMLQLRQEL